MIPNANIVTSSFDRISGSLVSPATQSYNNLRIQTLGANIIQGQVNKLSLTELILPYDIPTVVAGVNDSIIVIDRSYTVGQPSPIDPAANSAYKISVPQRFYTGAEIVSALNASFAVVGGGLSLSASVDPVSGAVSITNTATWDATPAAVNHLYEIGPYLPLTVPSYYESKVYNTPQLLWTIGFRPLYSKFPWKVQADQVPIDPTEHAINLVPLNTPAPVIAAYAPNGGVQTITGTVYTGAFTNYIDIVSPSLTQAQFVRDSTTSQATVKKDVICRVYVSDNISIAGSNNSGSRPFVIYRIFPCPKVMKWTVDRSVDAISLELYDMFGRQLPDLGYSVVTEVGGATSIGSGPRDYGITFHVHEHDDTMEPNVGYKY